METHLEEAAKVGVLENVLGFDQGTDRESDLVLGLGSGLVSDLGTGLESGLGTGPGTGLAPGPESDPVLGLELEWEFDQAPAPEPPQECDQGTGPGKFQVVLGRLGHDQVSGHH